MRSKSPHMIAQLAESPLKLQEVAAYFMWVVLGMGKQPVITRVWDAVEGESGVHPAKRAVDFRDECGGKRAFTDEEAREICELVNAHYARRDGKKVAIHHSSNGGPLHFHLQIPAAWIFTDV